MRQTGGLRGACAEGDCGDPAHVVRVSSNGQAVSSQICVQGMVSGGLCVSVNRTLIMRVQLLLI